VQRDHEKSTRKIMKSLYRLSSWSQRIYSETFK
jgi:hypothetical protein